jgi:hypothetical protein
MKMWKSSLRQRHPTLLLSMAMVLSSIAQAQKPELRVVFDDNKRPIAVEATGWTREELSGFVKDDPDYVGFLTNRLKIFVLDKDNHLQQPGVAGKYEAIGEALRMSPQFPLRPGMRYRACFSHPTRSRQASAQLESIDFAVPSPPPPPPTKVIAIYPSASRLPENQLRFYLHFSAPMSSGEAYEHVKLIREDGKVVTRAFLEIGEELWDGTGTRLTLLFDPGRVKTGLKPREEFGPVLEAGKSYRLVIENGFRDANNQPLAEVFEKRFKAGPMIEAAVDAKQWKIESPASGSRQSLVVTFPRPLDRALLMRMITVVSLGSKEVSGDVSVSDEERRWQFTPDQPWVAAKHELVIDTALEDSAGNNLARPFEVDVFERVDKQPGPEFVRLPFTIR